MAPIAGGMAPAPRATDPGHSSAMKITDFLSPEAVLPELNARTKPEVLRELAEILKKTEPSLRNHDLVAVLNERERLGSTGIGEGVAIPHGKVNGMSGLRAVFGLSRGGVDFEAIDGRPTHLFFALLAPEHSAGIHLKALARVSRLFKSPTFRASILSAADAGSIYDLIVQEDARA